MCKNPSAVDKNSLGKVKSRINLSYKNSTRKRINKEYMEMKKRKINIVLEKNAHNKQSQEMIVYIKGSLLSHVVR